MGTEINNDKIQEFQDNVDLKKSQKRLSVCKIIIFVIIGLIVCVGSFFGGYLFRSGTYQKETNTIDYIIKMMKEHYYYDNENTDYVQLFDDAILDRYSEYYSKEEYQAIKQGSVGAREGIGISYRTDNNTVSQIAWNSPCDRAGMKVGGVITGIKTPSGDYTIKIGDDLGEIINAVPANTDFTMKVSYNGGTPVEHVIAREFYTETFARYYDDVGEYACQANESGKMEFVSIGENLTYDLEGKTDVGVLSYRGFNGLNSGLNGGAGQFIACLRRFKENGKHNLILDLRNNPGGYLDILSEVSAHLINAEYGKSVPIISEIDKNDKVTEHKSAAVVSSDYGFKSIVVLVDEGTASASEALVGAMLDYDSENIVSVIVEEYIKDATVIPNEEERIFRSYGKGIMQTTFENFATGTAIKLTTAQLFWPKSNICIHGTGITVELNDEAYFNGVKKVYNESNLGCVHDALSLSK